MFSWLFIIILAYFFFSIASLGDKLVLNRAQNPKLYVFYVGVLGLFVLFLIPFVGFSILDRISFLWVFLASLFLISSLYFLYSAVEKFDVSRVVPIFGSVQPAFILFLSWFFFRAGVIGFNNILAFTFLLLGSIMISFEKKPEFTKNLLSLSLFASFLMALSFIFLKVVFLSQPFFQSIIWMGIFNFLIVLFFLFDAKFRKEVFINNKPAFDKKTMYLVLGTQSAGGLGGILQNFAIFLAPVSGLAIINAMKGIQYVFLFVITLLFSKFLP